MKCALCDKDVVPQTPVVSTMGGFFTEEDPPLFVGDDEVMREVYLHRDCFIEAVKKFIEA